MEVVLHIGMPKTGTTSLQHTMADNRSNLLDHGILYPKLTAMQHAHHLLAPLFSAPQKCWGRVKDHLGGDPASLTSGARREWKSVQSQIAQNKPETVVLSTEALFVTLEASRLNEFREMIMEIADSVRVVAYVRSPAKFYRSILLERAKRGIELRHLAPISYRRPIEQFEEAFSTAAIIGNFERANLKGQDINVDFFHNIFDLKPWSTTSEVNQSLSPEAMEVYQIYMTEKTNQRHWKVGPEKYRILNTLAQIEHCIGRSETSELRMNVAERIEEISIDVDWLRNEKTIGFPRLRKIQSVAHEGEVAVRSLRDAFVMDDCYQAEIISEFVAMRELPPTFARSLQRGLVAAQNC